MAGAKVAAGVDIPRMVHTPPFDQTQDPRDTGGLQQEYGASHLPFHGAYDLCTKSFGFLLSDFVVTFWVQVPQMVPHGNTVPYWRRLGYI